MSQERPIQVANGWAMLPVTILIFAAGVWLFVRDASGAVWLSIGLFALLVLTNCALISRWEMDIDRLQGQTSLALESPRMAGLIAGLPWLAGLAAVVVLGAGPAELRPAALAALASALLLAGVDRLEPRLGWPLARVMSDLALMTPVAVLVLG